MFIIPGNLKNSSQKVRAEAYGIIARVAAWSMKIAAEGIAPEQGFAGESFAQNSKRAKLAGQTLAKGWRPTRNTTMFYHRVFCVFLRDMFNGHGW